VAFSDLGSIGSAGTTTANQTTIVLTTTATCNAGDLVVVVVGVDNRDNQEDDESVTGVVDSTGANDYYKIGGGATAHAAQAGASCQVFASVIGTQLNSGGTITATFQTNTTSDAQCIMGRRFSFTGGRNGLGIEGFNRVRTSAADPASLDATTQNVACLRIRAIAGEVGNTTFTATTNWTGWANPQSAAGTTGEISIRAEHRISTATSDASNPTWVSCDNVGIYIALRERTTQNILLLHGNGTDGSTTITDSGDVVRTCTAVGNTQLDTAQQKFGTASILFDGTADEIDLSSGGGDFGFGLADFTIDFWLRLNATGQEHILFEPRSPAIVDVAGVLYVNSADILAWNVVGIDKITGTTALTTGVWNHVALTRSGTSLRLFLNGTQEGSTFTDKYGYPHGGTTRPVWGGTLNGWIDEVRVRFGEAAWTANFTPPAAEYGAVVVSDPPFYLRPMRHMIGR
jgi:Concanavalin A-like lectin/glucanases superfamily